jgi:hypothetical protein
MSKPWTWINLSILAILAMLLTAPILNSPALVQSGSITDLPLTGPHAIRLIADLLGLAIFCILAFAALQQIPDKGRGTSVLHDLSRANLYTRVAGTSPHRASDPLNLYLISLELPNYFRGEHQPFTGIAHTMSHVSNSPLTMPRLNAQPRWPS